MKDVRDGEIEIYRTCEESKRDAPGFFQESSHHEHSTRQQKGHVRICRSPVHEGKPAEFGQVGLFFHKAHFLMKLGIDNHDQLSEWPQEP